MDHDQIDKEDYIQRLIRGELNPDERVEFDEHYVSCTRCLDKLHEEIRQEETVDRYLLHRLSPPEAEFFERHFLMCDTCLQEVKARQLVISGLKEAARKENIVFDELPAKASSGWLAWLKDKEISPLVAVVATVLVILVGYSMYHTFFTLPDVREQLSDLRRPQANALAFSLDTRFRGAAAQRIELPDKEENTPFILTFTILDASRPDARYTAVITDSSGHIIWRSKDLRPTGEYGMFTVLCWSSFFAEGEYELTVNEIEPGSGRQVESDSFGFEVVFRDGE